MRRPFSHGTARSSRRRASPSFSAVRSAMPPSPNGRDTRTRADRYNPLPCFSLSYFPSHPRPASRRGVTERKCFFVHFDSFLRDARKQRAFKFFAVESQPPAQRAEHDGVRRLGIACLERERKRVDARAAEHVFDARRVLRRARHHGHGHDLLRGVQHPPVRLEIMRIAQRFQLFKGEDEVRAALVDDGRSDLAADAHISHDAAAALCHAVHFAELDVVPLFKGVFA